MKLNKKSFWILVCLVPVLVLVLGQCTQSRDLNTGKEIFQVYCVNCHGVDGSLGTNAAMDLTRSGLPLDGRIEIIRHGRVTMMGFKNVLTEAQIDSVARYTLELQE